MKGLYFDGKKAVYRENLAIPVPDEGRSLIRIMLAAVCSTDKEIREGYAENIIVKTGPLRDCQSVARLNRHWRRFQKERLFCLLLRSTS